MPNMTPYIEAQRELIKRVQERKTGLLAKEEKTNLPVIQTSDDSPLIKTQYGDYTLNELNPQTGLPMEVEKSLQVTTSPTIPRFWMYVPIPKEALETPMNGSTTDVPTESTR